MPLMPVASWRSGDSLPAELRTGCKEWAGSNLMPSLRLSAGQSGLSGMSIHYGGSEGPSGFRAAQTPPYGYRGMSGLGFNSSAYPASIEWDRNAGWSGLGMNVDAYPANGEWCRYGWQDGWGGLSGLGQTCDPNTGPQSATCICIDNGDGTQTCFPSGGTDTTGGGIVCQGNDLMPLAEGQVYCSSNSTIPASAAGQAAQAQNLSVNIGGATVQTQHPPGWTGQTVCLPGQACPQAPNGYTWIPVISATGNMLAQIMAISQGGSYSQSPRGIAVSGTPYAPAAGTAASTASQTNLFSGTGGMMLLIGSAVFVMFMFSQSRK